MTRSPPRARSSLLRSPLSTLSWRDFVESFKRLTPYEYLFFILLILMMAAGLHCAQRADDRTAYITLPPRWRVWLSETADLAVRPSQCRTGRPLACHWPVRDGLPCHGLAWPWLSYLTMAWLIPDGPSLCPVWPTQRHAPRVRQGLRGCMGKLLWLVAAIALFVFESQHLISVLLVNHVAAVYGYSELLMVAYQLTLGEVAVVILFWGTEEENSKDPLVLLWATLIAAAVRFVMALLSVQACRATRPLHPKGPSPWSPQGMQLPYANTAGFTPHSRTRCPLGLCAQAFSRALIHKAMVDGLDPQLLVPEDERVVPVFWTRTAFGKLVHKVLKYVPLVGSRLFDFLAWLGASSKGEKVLLGMARSHKTLAQ